ncbi:helix-turn-helix domain-containing protein [Qipengyuania psychrotolerans]|uniref:Short-chain fatty acyl-CoA regulator family protein n=1 Tax=Qipengyuania psychrotolerans TaxID=2867238 RepID=A0ABX8ZG63_9SPHN|nr:short-chain fatty acyl-CoA regulator family protein [Qipengyuania psychrotolerans]QZD87972.1 short-chain fatty acyl-CoA regulator family protein [Qipengyuania psychrotolerans]
MAENALLAGPAIRRVRKRESLTQAAMATRLSISPSYLNLIERNQRPVSARVVMALVEQFDFDPRSLREDEAVGGLDGLMRRLSDERFADLAIDREEAEEFLATVPQIAAAFARLYDRSGPQVDALDDALAASRREIERWRNHFSDLDHAAEELADEIRLSRGDIGLALTERLRERHQFSVRVLPRDVLPESLSRLDLHARQVQLSEMLAPASRNFQLALKIAQLEQRDAVEAVAQGAKFDDEAARALFRRHLEGYFAAALLMPYGRFMRACEATGYDLPVLERRFSVSFEQLAHRLTTLQRVGQRGLPFFMVRIDRAGQFSKSFMGASTAHFASADVSCPLWDAHRAFEMGGDLVTQFVSLQEASEAEGGGWLTMMQSVEGSGAPGEARFVVAIGIEAVLAGELAQARGLSLRPSDAQPIGPGCAGCQRLNCRQRSLPPRGRKLHFDRMRRGNTPFEFGER